MLNPEEAKTALQFLAKNTHPPHTLTLSDKHFPALAAAPPNLFSAENLRRLDLTVEPEGNDIMMLFTSAQETLALHSLKMLFFDGALLALGNVSESLDMSSNVVNDMHDFEQILFISGLTFIIGPQKTFYFFARKQKIRGTVCFFGGVLLVFFKRPFIGMIVETFGFLNLFGHALSNFFFFPSVLLT